MVMYSFSHSGVMMRMRTNELLVVVYTLRGAGISLAHTNDANNIINIASYKILRACPVVD
jgi:hypothetical protein